MLKIGRKPIDDAGTPALRSLAIENVASDAPVQEHKLAIDGERSAETSRGNARLQLREKLDVRSRAIGNFGTHAPNAAVSAVIIG
jgi:hypothetical protein